VSYRTEALLDPAIAFAPDGTLVLAGSSHQAMARDPGSSTAGSRRNDDPVIEQASLWHGVSAVKSIYTVPYFLIAGFPYLSLENE